MAKSATRSNSLRGNKNAAGKHGGRIGAASAFLAGGIGTAVTGMYVGNTKDKRAQKRHTIGATSTGAAIGAIAGGYLSGAPGAAVGGVVGGVINYAGAKAGQAMGKRMRSRK